VLQIFSARPNPEVEVLGEARDAMEADRVPTDDEIFNLMIGERRQDVSVIGLESHVPAS
jgi:hypothetical protein